MIAALDATPLVEPHGGVARYTRELSRALASCFPDDDFWLVSDQHINGPETPAANLRVSAGERQGLARRWWSVGLRGELNRLGAHVFHGTDFAVPYFGGVPSVMTIHDLSPWRPTTSNPNLRAAVTARVRQRAPLLVRLRRATMIVTPSEAIRRSAMERFGIPAADIAATPLAAAPCFKPCGHGPGAGRDRPYFVLVAKANPRKNAATVEAAYGEVMRHHDAELVIGDGRSDAELALLYSGAMALLFPSLYEGFGLPVLEAMQCGSPVIASRDPAVMEVAGDAAVLLDAGDIGAWVEAMRKMIADREWREGFRQRSLARAAGFSWERTARLTREVYGEAIARFHHKG